MLNFSHTYQRVCGYLVQYLKYFDEEFMAEHAVEHTVAITAYLEEKRDDYNFKAPTTYAVATVEPPIYVDDETILRQIVLGDEWTRVNITKLYANAKAAVFRVESSAPELEERHENIAVIAQRLGHMANSPQDVLAMMKERVFAEQKPEPRLEVVREIPSPNEDEASVLASPEAEPKEGGVTVRLAPVEIPPLTGNVPPPPTLLDSNVKPQDLPPVRLPDVVTPQEPDQPTAFGPPRAGFTRLAPEARILPWPPQSADGRHARKEQTDN